MAKAFHDGSHWCKRMSLRGERLHISKCASARTEKKGKPKDFGAERTMLAQALQDYAAERLAFMKGTC